MLTLAAVVAIPVALTYIALLEVTALVVRIGRWPILFALVTMALAVLETETFGVELVALCCLHCGGVLRCCDGILIAGNEPGEPAAIH